MTLKIIYGCFYALFIFTPLIFTPYNNELFEFNKMLLTYLLTVIIAGSWLIRMVNAKKLIFKSTFLDIPLLIFFLSQIISTILSIDTHTSVWGYYSRLNGGLLSISAYLVLYWAFVSNIEKSALLKMVKVSVIGGLLVALWAVPEHFGYSFSCLFLVGRWAADCWVQDVQSRVFASIGQPNWLAAYLAMMIFPTIYFFITEKKVLKKVFFLVSLIIYYLAFTFTFSRGGSLGLIGGGVVSGLLIVWLTFRYKIFDRQILKYYGIVIGLFIVINLLFGSALTGSFRLIKENAPPPRPTIAASGGTQLENGGTESGQIRLIVWKGALEIFKHFPLTGSGVETFAYSYYLYRPTEHNLVSEWDFLYNKAHNEYLNYLATTGLIGFFTYLGFILLFIVWAGAQIFSKNLFLKPYSLGIEKQSKPADPSIKLFLILILGGYISYLIQNIFGFSVVIIAVLFYLFPAFVFVILDPVNKIRLTPFIIKIRNLTSSVLYKPLPLIEATWWNPAGLVKVIILGLTFYLVSGVFNLWRADVNYKLGSDAADAGSANKAYLALFKAHQLNPREPLYQSDLGNVLASAAIAMDGSDATETAELKSEAIALTENSLKISPYNLSLWRTAVRTYYVLSINDPSYDQKTIDTINQAILLAPTDPKLYYNKALILMQQNKYLEAIEAMNKAIELKPNYREAKISLGEIYIKNKQPEQAIDIINQVLDAIPNDPDALKVLQEASQSANK